MTTFRREPFLSELVETDTPIPEEKLEYLGERLRNNLYNFIISKFLERQETHGLTQAKLARRIDYDPGRLSKLLGAPGNWTMKTISDLLAGISAEELEPKSRSLLGRPPRNYRGVSWLYRSMNEPQEREHSLAEHLASTENFWERSFMENDHQEFRKQM